MLIPILRGDKDRGNRLRRCSLNTDLRLIGILTTVARWALPETHFLTQFVVLPPV